MKKLFVPAICLLVIIVLFVSFNNKQNQIVQKTFSEAIDCAPYYSYNPTASSFEVATTARLIRKNINDTVKFTDNDWIELSNAYKAMKELDTSNINDPTGWEFQTKIHYAGLNIPQNSPSFNTCQHGNCFFLSWHRVYLYFFERILRSKMEGTYSKTTALPYWDSRNTKIKPNNDVLPLRFRKKILPTVPKKRNFLYHDNRGSKINDTSPLPLTHLVWSSQTTGNSIMQEYNLALSKKNFHTFQNTIESAHNGVHQAIGGDMPNMMTAPLDPIFFSHHANIDRMWEGWLRKGGGRCNPKIEDDPIWWNKTFTFYDEKGQPKPLSNFQIIKIAAQLNYVYDDYPFTQSYSTTKCNKKFKDCSSFPYPTSSNKVIRITYPYLKISSKSTKLNDDEIKVDGDENILTNGKIDIKKDDRGDLVYLEFENININKKPQGVIEIYLNPQNSTKLLPNDKSFAGLLNLFSSDHGFKHGLMKHESKTIVSVSHVVQKLKLSLSNLKKAKIYFIVRGNGSNGKEIQTEANLTIGKTSIIVYTK